jgi:LysM domain
MAAVVHAHPGTARHPVLVSSAAVPARPATAPVSPPTVSPLTYRRRRAAAAGILVALVLAVQGLLAVLGGDGTGPSPRPVPTGQLSAYVVQPGDTLWSIAVRLEPHRDPRPLVDRLVAEHGSATLVVGERIALPERG